MDAVPGRYTDLWFKATEPGDYPIFCTEYCGTQHSDMLSRVIVHEKGGYEAWIKKQLDEIQRLPLPELGALTAQKKGCFACHTIDGTPKLAPTWLKVFGKTEATSAGPVKVDENYLRESIVDPHVKLVDGYGPVMPVTKLTDREIDGLIEYIKTLK
jgi:cytochrome c oxidase subunit 2